VLTDVYVRPWGYRVLVIEFGWTLAARDSDRLLFHAWTGQRRGPIDPGSLQ
jgi:hypothetical protein